MNRAKMVVVFVGVSALVGTLLATTGHRAPLKGLQWEAVGGYGPRASAPTPSLSVAARTPFSPGQASPSASATVAGGTTIAMAALLAAAVALIARHRRRARAEAALLPGALLAEGPAVVFGVVEGGAGTESPVVVTIYQAGSEYCNKGQWRHTWKEQRREVDARPFTLVRADGVRVSVEPDERVVVHDKLTEIRRHDVASRSRVATVRPGDEIHVTGELSGMSAGRGAYRGSGAQPVLRPPRSSPMVVAHEPVGETERERMRFHVKALAALVAAALALGALLAPYVTFAFQGRVVQALATHTATWRVWVKPKNSAGYWQTHYAVRAAAFSNPQTGEPLTLDAECDRELYDRARAGQAEAIPFVVAGNGGGATYALGDRATLARGALVGLLLIVLAAGIAYPVVTHGTAPWYLRRKVDDSGSGRLSESE